MRKEVVEFICDNCGHEAVAEDIKTVVDPLPKNWVEIFFKTNSEALEPVQTCELCKDAVAKALFDRRNASSQEGETK